MGTGLIGPAAWTRRHVRGRRSDRDPASAAGQVAWSEASIARAVTALPFPQTLIDRLAVLAENRTALTALPSGFGALGRLALRSPAAAPLARLLPRPQQRLVRAYHLIRAAGLFDRSWYLSRHPVPARGRTDPLRHFLEEGTARGFLPAAEWVGLDAESCAALANRHGKAGRELWRYMRYGRAPGADGFRDLATGTLGPFAAAPFLGALEAAIGDEKLPLDLLIVDHAMGGGANRYRNARVAEATAQGAAVGLLTYRVQERLFVLELALGGRHLAVASPDLPTLEPLLLRFVPGLTLLNNIVSYPDAIGMLKLTHRVAGDGALEVPLHDYFAICPSLNLLDDQSRYCGVPELSRCRTCLAQVALPLPGQQATRDIDGWRAAWATVLRRANSIVGFSRSSRELLARAYPWLDSACTELRPHRVDYLPSRSVALDFAADLHIGVVGEISVAKGAAIVAAIDRHLRDTGSAIRLSVIGTLDKHQRCDVPETGRYRVADLPRLIGELRVNVCLIPSIWPETFCYVAEELLGLGMPVAVFDLGAPAERVRTSPRGVVLESMDPARIVGDLQVFWRSLQAANQAEPARLLVPAA